MNNIYTLARKPTDQSSVALNVQLYGTGGLNIDGTRIAHNEECKMMSAQSEESLHNPKLQQGGRHKEVLELKPEGRWPANLVFIHHPECVFVGVEEDNFMINRWVDDALPFGGAGGKGLEFDSVAQIAKVPVYSCHPNCPGNALRDRVKCFKQVEVMSELIQYLKTMISPPDGNILVFNVAESPNLYEIPEETYHGVIVIGTLDNIVDQVYRVVKPGGHVVSIPSDSSPTNFQNACLLEDQGFEIRDSILVPSEPGMLHYVPKPGVREKGAGLEGKNPHPTVKPIEIMEKLLQNVPDDEVVVDPFLGSGTTGIATLRSRHSFIGMELSREYLEIADKRIRHWDRVVEGWSITDIESDVKEEEKTHQVVDIFDL